MYKTKLILAFLFSMVVGIHAKADNTHNHDDEHVSMLEVFQGDGDEGIVCYKSKHRNFFFITFAMVVALVLLVYSRFRIKKRLLSELEEKTRLLEEKQKEILDSIHYASRIQQSLLPKEKYIVRVLKESKK
jgi:hypothetical protein